MRFHDSRIVGKITRVLLFAFSLVVLADYAEILLCGDEVEAAACCSSMPGSSGETEDQCDHCVACSVGHGHLASLSAEKDPGSHVLNSRAFSISVCDTTSDPESHEFFHPPLRPPAELS